MPNSEGAGCRYAALEARGPCVRAAEEATAPSVRSSRKRRAATGLATRIRPREALEFVARGLGGRVVLQEPIVGEEWRRRAGHARLIVAQVVPEGCLNGSQMQQVAIRLREVLLLLGVARVVVSGLPWRNGLATRPSELRHPHRQLSGVVVHELLLVG